MVESDHPLFSGPEQCELLDISRSFLYYTPAPESEANLLAMRLMDRERLRHPFYGKNA
jgi:putative transposase